MIIVWSFNFIIADIAFDFMTPLPFSLYRFIIATIAFIFIDIIIKLKNNNQEVDLLEQKNEKFNMSDWILIITASFIGQSFYFYTLYGAIALIGPSLPALFVCLLSPVIIAILALFLFKEKLNKFKILGFCIATFGAFFLVTGGNLNTLLPSSPNFIGYLFALITPLQWAIYSTLTKKLSKVNSMLKILKYTTFLATIELFVFVLFTGEFLVLMENLFNPVIILCAIYTGFICHVIGYYIWQHSQQELESSKVASFLYVEPFITLIFSFILQRNETIVFWNIMGGLIVLMAVLIINYETKKKMLNIPAE